jgi:hypothetical protein
MTDSGAIQDFSNKAGVVHSEIMLPEGAPERLNDRATLWNEVEAARNARTRSLPARLSFQFRAS